MLFKSRWVIGLAALVAIWMSVNGCQCSLTRAWFDSRDHSASTSQPFSDFQAPGVADRDVLSARAQPAGAFAPAADSEPGLLGDPVGPVTGDRVRLEVLAAHPYLLAGRTQRTFVKIGLTGFDLEAGERQPANVAIVLDRSGSMAGERLERAKEAAGMVFGRLRSDDVISVIAYDDNVDVLVPATGAGNTLALVEGIQHYSAGGRTALHAGVVAGAAEVRKHLDRDRINRVVLLSDGEANVGPSSPAALGALGAELGAEGIGVTTIGLGLSYNTELMTALANRSEGNHFFARTADDLATGFALEFGLGLAVVGRDAVIQVRFAEGFRPAAALNAKAQIQGQTVTVNLAQLYANHKAYLLLEVEAFAGRSGTRRNMAQVDVAYENLKTGRTDRLRQDLAVEFTDSANRMQVSEQAEVMEAVTIIEAAHHRRRAVELRQSGQLTDAKREFEQSAASLRQRGHRLRSAALEAMAKQHQASADHIDDDRAFGADTQLYGHKNMKHFGMRSRPY